MVYSILLPKVKYFELHGWYNRTEFEIKNGILFFNKTISY